MSIKKLFGLSDETKLRKLMDVPQSSIGAPIPMLVSGEHSLSLVFYLQAYDPDWDGTTVRLVGQNSSDESVCVVRFERPYAHMFGPPNEEAIDGHPLYKVGLKPFDAVEVIGSEWIEELCTRNSVHPYHSDDAFADFHHYIFTFHDTTFEAIASGYTVENIDQSSVMAAIKSELQRWSNE